MRKEEFTMRNLQLYIHIPFCVQKCAYCDFLSAPADIEIREEYVKALIREIYGYRSLGKDCQVSTIFIGGGTPSLLTSEQIELIFQALRSVFTIMRDAEITIEANPGTVSREKLQAWKQAGINRISFGLQSVDDRELKMLGRIHTFAEFQESYRMAADAGFDNINVDLISAIPGQTVESWRKTLYTTAGLVPAPTHISAYSLIVEPGTPFYERYGNGEAKGGYPRLPDEESERLMYEETQEILKRFGYYRYEISNYARAGKECRHNLGYWERKEYLGIGLGAASLIDNTRYHLVADLPSYIKKTESGENIREEIEQLSRDDRMEEFMFLGLRKMNGVSRREFEELFGETMDQVYGIQIEKLTENGLLIDADERIYLSGRGIDISNYVFEQFLL